ncbi:MAG: hypothetical protein HY445_00520 [Candidatus Niyogibacteria bacterium]|nr:hypothetical protein [Candidatus Niyogibacteria bacterium]
MNNFFDVHLKTIYALCFCILVLSGIFLFQKSTVESATNPAAPQVKGEFNCLTNEITLRIFHPVGYTNFPSEYDILRCSWDGTKGELPCNIESTKESLFGDWYYTTIDAADPSTLFYPLTVSGLEFKNKPYEANYSSSVAQPDPVSSNPETRIVYGVRAVSYSPDAPYTLFSSFVSVNPISKALCNVILYPVSGWIIYP